MADGHLNKCKDCTKRDSADNKTIPRTCSECGKNFLANPNEVKRKGGGANVCSRTCYYERLRFYVKRGEESPNWKGDDVGYDALHNWVRKNLGTPMVCELCGTRKAKVYDWSNKSGEYKRDVSDWQRLCRKCHLNYDNQPEKRRATMIERYGTAGRPF